MARYFVGFDEAGILTSFTNRWHPDAYGAMNIVANLGDTHALEFTPGTTNGTTFVSYDPLNDEPSRAISEIVAGQSFDTLQSMMNHLYVWGAGTSTTRNSYHVILGSNIDGAGNSGFRIRKYAANSFYDIGAVALPIVINQLVHTRLKVEDQPTGNAGARQVIISAKAWTGTIADEPAAWGATFTDTANLPTIGGMFGVGLQFAAGSKYFNYLGVGTGGDVAPTAVVDDTTIVTELRPDSILASTNLGTPDFNVLREDPDAAVTTWLTAPTATADTSVRMGFDNPSSALKSSQSFKVFVRKTAGTPNPTLAAELWQTGGTSPLKTLTLSSSSVDSTTGKLITVSGFTSTDVVSGNDVQLRLIGTAGQSTGESPHALLPSSISGTNITGVVGNITDDPTAPDTLYVSPIDDSINYSFIINLAAPPSTLTGTQTLQAFVRKTPGINAGSFSVDIDYGSGTFTAGVIPSTVMSSATGALYTFSFPASNVVNANALRLQFNGVSGTGKAADRANAELGAARIAATITSTPGNVNTVEYGAVEWTARHEASTVPKLTIATATATAETTSVALTQRHVLTATTVEASPQTSSVTLAAVIPLTVPDAVASPETSSVNLTQHHLLTSAPATAPPATDSVGLTQHHALTATAATVGTEASAVSLTQHHALSVGAATAPVEASSVSLSANLDLTVPSAEVGVVATAVALTQHHALSSSSVEATPGTSAVSLTQHHALSAASVSATPEADAVALAAAGALTPTNLTVSPGTSSAALTQHHVLSIPALEASVAASSVSLSANLDLAIPSAEAGTAANAVSLTQHYILSVPSAGVSPEVSSVALAAAGALTVTPLTAAPETTPASLTQRHVLTPSSAEATPGTSSVSLTQRHVLSPSSLAATPEADSISFGKLTTLATSLLEAGVATDAVRLTQRYVLGVPSVEVAVSTIAVRFFTLGFIETPGLISLTPTHSLINRTPVQALLDQTPERALISHTPTKALLNQTPQLGLIDRTPKRGLLDRTPNQTLL